MDWKALADDIVLFNDLVNRFVEIGCTEKKAFELASAKLPVKTTFVSLDQF